MSFEAKYYGRCDACSEKIEPGDSVCFIDDDLVHTVCDTLPVHRRVDGKVCTRCFQQMPLTGVCDNCG